MKALIALSALGVLALFAEIFRFKKALFPLTMLGLAGAAALVYIDRNTPLDPMFHNMVRFDRYALLFMLVLIGIAFLWFVMSFDSYKESAHVTDYYSLAIFSLIGGICLVCYNNLVMLFLGVEILSVPVYVLAGSRKDDLRSNESAFKYFLMGAFASAILLFGIALVYGSSGTLYIGQIVPGLHSHPGAIPGLFQAGVILILTGLAFKVSAAPFHFWAPDVYQGAPTPVTALMATLVKTAAVVALVRLFMSVFFPFADNWANIVAMLVLLTLLVGNVTAVFQGNVKRMLAYSSISHAGFMLMALLFVWPSNPFSTILYYTVAYSVASITAFAILNAVSVARGNESINAFNGLAKTNPGLALAMAVALLSMAGIPPTAGFFAKYYVFVGLLMTPYKWVAIPAVLMALVGVYYYFRIIITMYFREPGETGITPGTMLKLLLLITTLATILLGILPDLVLHWV